MTTIETPRSPSRPARKGGINWDKTGWMFMRGSGVLLLVLIFGHLIVNLVLGGGIKQVDFGFVAGKYATPFWRIWDLLMLWFALIHGANGMRTIINDYAYSRTVNRALKIAVLVAAIVLIVLGTLVVTTFDPCTGSTPGQFDFCPAS